MYQTTLSLASTKAASLIGAEIGLVTASTVEPVMCLFAAGKVAQAVDHSGVVSGVAGDVVGAVADVADVWDSAVQSVGDFFSSIFYMPPGRMPVGDTQVADNASIDELISSTRGRNAA